jgi:transglutaminase-like putative cysteine protease
VDLKQLLSIVTAALTAMGAILYSMGAQHTWLALGLWLAVISSLVVTDFLGVLKLNRSVGSFLMWCALGVFVIRYLLTLDWRILGGHSPDWQLDSVIGLLIFLQCVLLFQDKDARIFGWLAVMSLLQVVVAARYSRGVGFGGVLVVYSIVGLFDLSLLALYGQRHRGQASTREKEQFGSRDGNAWSARWPLAAAETEFTSAPSGSDRAGIVPEFFGRLSLIIVGGLLLAMVIFYTAPRPRIPSWRGDTNRKVSVVGFNDRIQLGGLGDMVESREEVMRVRLLDPSTRRPYLLQSGEIYLRGTAVNWYSENQWHRLSPAAYREGHIVTLDLDGESVWGGGPPSGENEQALRIGGDIVQKATVEPDFSRTDLFFVWPLVDHVNLGRLQYEPQSERLFRKVGFDGEIPPGEFTYETTTSGLVDGRQAELVPARRREDRGLLLQLSDEGKGLPRLAALAEKWRREFGLKPGQNYEIARYFEQQLSSSGQFHYSLQPVERDTSIDAVEDFVSNNPRGHCEYFATALALMLRSQRIPARVILGYRCDEWDPKDQSFQVRQLHAHAWVEAFLDPDKVPEALRKENPKRWTYGGWLRLDATPGDDLGSTAANSTTLGAWAARWHALQHYWERYIADMDRAKQQESVYEPIRAAIKAFTSQIFSPKAWRELFASAWHGLAALMRSGIIGKLFGTVLLIVIVGATLLAGWLIARQTKWLWQRLFGRGGSQASRARASVEFYHRFELLAAEFGLMRRAGETPREFALAAGARMASVSGRPELSDRAKQVAEAFYSVRFGQQELPAKTIEAIQNALEELKLSAAGQKLAVK